MTNQILIDAAHQEEVRVAVTKNNRLEEYDFEFDSRRPIRGNIYLAKVTRVEPSLQAAFVDYGGNRNGFLPFAEVHPDYYQIPVADKEAILEKNSSELINDETDEVINENLNDPSHVEDLGGDDLEEIETINKKRNKDLIKNYKIQFTEKGAIPLFYPENQTNKRTINIGSLGGMTRLSTGYTFLNIQEHSKYICDNIETILTKKKFTIGKKYQLLDKIFLRVLKNNPEKMPKIFFEMFKASPGCVIKFLSNKSNILEDINIIGRMPKFVFMKALFY